MKMTDENVTPEADPAEKMRETITKLLAKAASSTHPEEAETFAAKAQELMTKWAIDELQLVAAGQTQSDVVVHDFTTPVTHYKENFSILSAVAKANDVKMIYTPYVSGRSPVAHLIGFQSDIDSALAMYVALMSHVKLAMKPRLLESTHGERPTPKEARQFGSSFRLGFASVIGTRLTEARAQTVNEADIVSGGSLLPALIDKTARVLDAATEAFPKTKTSRNVRVQAGAYVAGQAAAKSADVGSAAVTA